MVARNKVVLSGVIAGGIERFAVSCDYADSGGGTVTDPGALQQWADLIAIAIGTGPADFPTITAAMGANVNVTQVKVYSYDATGPATAVGESSALWLGSGTIRVPFSTSICVSKRTDQAGRTHRGRMYWPALGITMNSNGTFNNTQLLVDEFAQLLVDMGNVDGINFSDPVVTSLKDDVVTQVTSVRVGGVPDSQQGRRDGLVETYLTAPIVP